MQDLNDKITGDTLLASEWNEVPSEIQNVIENLGQTLTSADLNQLGKGIAGYVANGNFYIDSGIADAYILSVVGSKQSSPFLTDGFKVEFLTTNPNTGAATVNVASLGVKNIKTENGSDPLAGEISSRVELTFDSSSDSFILTNPSFTGIATEFETVQQMKDSTTLVPGDFARTFGYLTRDDGGANAYFIVAAATGVDDKGTFIDLTTHQAQGLFEDGVVRFEQYGAAGDGVTDDTISLNNASLNPVSSRIEISGKTFFTTGTVKFPSQKLFTAVYGKSRVKNLVSTRIIVSQAFVSSESVSPTGRLGIHNLEIEGDLTNLTQIGLTIHDFECDLRLVRVLLCGGGGIQLNHKNDIGAAVAGTLVQNRLTMPIISNCGGIGIDLGEPDNQKLTDGFLIGANISMKAGAAIVTALRGGSCAGWYITGVHTFGEIPPTAVDLSNCSRTRFVNFEIESFLNRGVNCPKIQGDFVVEGHIKADSAIATARGVNLDLSGLVTDTSVSVDIGVSLDTATAGITCLHNLIGSADIQARIRRRGTQRDLLKLVDGTDQGRIDQVRLMADASVAGVFTDKCNLSNQIGISHDAKRLSYNFYSPRLSGNGAQVVTVPVIVSDSQKLIGTIDIEANDFDDGGNLVVYQGRFFLSAKVNGVDAWVSNLITTITPAGFSVVPSITVTNTAGDDGTIVVNFTFSSANATGICSVSF